MDEKMLAMYAGVVLSLLFSYVPGLSDWYAKLSGTYKRLVMLGLLFVVAAGAFGLSCAGVLATVACTQSGLMGIVEAFIAAAIANQAAFTLTPQKAAS